MCSDSLDDMCLETFVGMKLGEAFKQSRGTDLVARSIVVVFYGYMMPQE